MAWQDESLPYLRILINDLGSSPEYCDQKLLDLLVVAASIIRQDIYFPTTYTVSISEQTITPDPSDNPNFINFQVLKAACLVDQSTYRTKAALEGLKAQVGPASLWVAGHSAAFKTLLELGACKMYSEMKLQYQFSYNLIYTVQAVLSPFVGNNFYPQDHLGNYSQGHRDSSTNNSNML